jgi:hypothetical protein
VGVGRVRPFAGVMLYDYLHDQLTVTMSEISRLGRPSGFLVYANCRELPGPVCRIADAKEIQSDKKTKCERPASNVPGLR